MFFQLFFTAIKCIFLDLFTDRNDIFLCRFIFFNHRNHSFHSTRTLTEKRYPIRAEPPSTGHYKEAPPPPRDGQYTFIFFCNFLFILLIEVLEPCCLLSPDESLVWSSGYREVVKSFNGCVSMPRFCGLQHHEPCS